MAFTFNFPDPSKSIENNVDTSIQTYVEDDVANNTTEDFHEFNVQDKHLDCDIKKQVYQISEVICVNCLDSSAVESKLCQTSNSEMSIRHAVSQHSDLVPNVYEGGLKVWECSIDLADYLNTCDVCFENLRVLELGCGAGIPGIVSMLKGATEVHFQDYNSEVIEHYTIPNVMLNFAQPCQTACRYFSGEWKKFKDAMKKENIKYGLILTAETIYTPVKYSKLADIFKEFLTADGKVLVAAKSNYFGVGGGTRDFENFIKKENVFSIRTCHTIHAGVTREILELTFK